MIRDVRVEKLEIHGDGRGGSMEVPRADGSFFEAIGQVVLWPRPIGAFHRHGRQKKICFFAAGMARVGLFDMRRDSVPHRQSGVPYRNRLRLEDPVPMIDG